MQDGLMSTAIKLILPEHWLPNFVEHKHEENNHQLNISLPVFCWVSDSKLTYHVQFNPNLISFGVPLTRSNLIAKQCIFHVLRSFSRLHSYHQLKRKATFLNNNAPHYCNQQYTTHLLKIYTKECTEESYQYSTHSLETSNLLYT